MGLRFEEDKPSDCRSCYFWKPKKERCSFGGEEHCYYLLPEEDQVKKETMCSGCPYGRDIPCIGFCIAKILAEDRKKRKHAALTGKEAGHAG